MEPSAPQRLSRPATIIRQQLPAFLRGIGRAVLLAGLLGAEGFTSRVQAGTSIPLTERTQLVFADRMDAAEILGAADRYVEQMSSIDRRLRLGAEHPVDKATYLNFAREQATDWAEKDRIRIAKALEVIQPRLSDFDGLWPATVILIRSTGREEAGAPHCRGNAIVWPAETLKSPPSVLATILAHELFHILSRQSNERQTQLYGILGFTTHVPITLPAALEDRKLTNPDAPAIDCVITLDVDGVAVPFAPILLTRESTYASLTGRSVFTELEFRLLQVKQVAGGWEAAMPEQPQLVAPETLPEYFEKIGRNTNYIIHPEEILADNFAHLIHPVGQLEDPWVVERLQKILQTMRQGP